MLNLDKKTLRNVFLVVLGCIFFYWLLHETERVAVVFGVIGNILSPFIAGATIAFILNVPMRAFENLFKGIKQDMLRRVVAMLLTFLSIALILALVFWLLIPELLDTVKNLIPTLETFALKTVDDVKELINKYPNIKQWIAQNADMQNLDWASLAQKALVFVGDSLNAIISGAFSAIGGVVGAMMNAFIAIVFAIYCLFQKENLSRQGRKILYAFFKESTADSIIRILRLTNSTFANFLSGQCVEVCILGSLFAVTMAIFRMPFIPLVSVLVAVTAFIPIVGAWVGCAFGAFLILVSNPAQAVLFVIMFIILQQIENNMIYPKVVGTSIGLSGMWVLVAVAVGGELLGVVGMFLMIPVASVIQTLLREATAKRLTDRAIDEQKLTVQPPELRARRKTKKKEKAQPQQPEAAPQEENTQ